MVSKVKVAAIQMNCVPYDKHANLSMAGELIERAVQQGARLIVLPELFNTGYYVADRDSALAEPIPGGETVAWMEEMCKKHNIYLAGAIMERWHCGGVLYDTNVLTGPDGYIGKYQKVCLWGNESLRFRHGDEYPVFDIGFAKVGLQICYEVGFPEGARILTLKGANLLLYSAAFGLQRSYVWELASRSRALENGLYIIASNRIGSEGENPAFASKSRIVSPCGTILSETEEENTVIVSEIDMDEVSRQRMTIPYLRDYKRRLFSQQLSSAEL